MNITRHNYETFFLLYVDKELSAADRKAVDVFVQENPDLQMELSLLQQTVVNADDVVLDKKDWLFMEEDISALQENILLYADNELTASDKNAVDSLLTSDKKALTEWNILQQTQLQPDMAVVFADKQSLYRKEDTRVVGFKWWRVAAAAVLLGLGLWTGLSVYKNYNSSKTGSTVLVNNNNSKTDQQKSSASSNNSIVTTVPEEKTATENNASTAVQKNITQPGENLKQTVESNNNNKNTVVPAENVAVQKSTNIKPNNNLPKPYFDNINSKAGNETTVVNVLPENNNNSVSGNTVVVIANPKENKTNTAIANVNTGNADQNVTATQVVNKTTADVDNNNRYLNVDDGKQKRTALGGFLRKAKRVLERTTNVKTGEGIKIAGFEIALK